MRHFLRQGHVARARSKVSRHKVTQHWNARRRFVPHLLPVSLSRCDPDVCRWRATAPVLANGTPKQDVSNSPGLGLPLPERRGPEFSQPSARRSALQIWHVKQRSVAAAVLAFPGPVELFRTTEMFPLVLFHRKEIFFFSNRSLFASAREKKSVTVNLQTQVGMQRRHRRAQSSQRGRPQ